MNSALLRSTAETSSTPKTEKAQGLVEFALIFPMLMILLLGIIEVGRMLVIYTSVTASSREAARYGSAAGISENGVPYFKDDVGIEAAARRITLLTGVTQVDIVRNAAPDHQCKEYGDTLPAGSTDICIIAVTVTADYTPLFGLVPALAPFPISSTTSRTIVKEIGIDMSGAGGGGGGGGGCTLVIHITAPPDGALITPGIPVVASATAADADCQDVSDTIDWSLDGSGGMCSPGASCNFGVLSDGPHTITASIPGGSDTVNITVDYPPPTIDITYPGDGASFCLRSFPITASGTATSWDSIPLSDQIQWGGIAGGVGANSNPIASPSIGPHTIQADITDPGSGKTATDQVTINVEDNPSPVLNIFSPIDDAVFMEGDPLTLDGQAMGVDTTCLVNQDISSAIIWRFDGSLVAGSPAKTLTIASLPAGDHTITADVTDPATGKSAATQTRVIHVYATDSLMVNFQQPVANYGLYTVSMYTPVNFSARADIGADNVTARSHWTWTDLSTGLTLGSGDGVNSLSNIVLGVTQGLTQTTHIIEARAYDGTTDKEGYATVTVIVTNTPPTVSNITVSPQNIPAGITDLIRGMSMVFSATGTDAEDTPQGLPLSWTWLDTATQFGTGITTTLDTTSWTVGARTITARATDSGGLSGSLDKNITLKEPTCPTGGSLDANSWSCVVVPSNKCEKLTWNFNATVNDPSTQTLDIFLESLTISWVVYSGNPNYQIDNVSFGAPTPTLFPLPGNTTTSPVQFLGYPLWYGNFTQINANTYGRTLTITFASNRYPNTGDNVDFTLYAKFQYCSQTQQSNPVHVPPK
jgi:Flp pilus assembly protein TadG